jgi:O-antigen/teichoic acid export membrane protein
VSAATVIGIQYYPRLCQLLADAGSDTRTHFDSLYRLLAWMGVSVAAVLLAHPGWIISVLFTAAYLNAAGPQTSLALAAGVLPIGQLGLWTLIAHKLRGWALAGAAAQLVTVLPFVAVALLVPQTPLWFLGAGHTLAAAVALAIAILGLRREGARYDWRPRRLALASLAALGTAAAVPGPEGSAAGVAAVAPLVVMCASVSVVTGLVLWSSEASSTFTRIRVGWRSAAAANPSDAQPTDIGLE